MRIVQVCLADDPLLVGMHALMERTFVGHENEPLAVTQAELRDHPGRHLVFVAVDETTGAVVGYATGAILPLLGPGGAPLLGPGGAAGEAFVCGCYLDRDPGYGGHKLGERLFQARLEAAGQQAVRQGVDLVGYLAECSTKEGFFNRIGARRLYVRTGPQHYAELPYYQPPMVWDAHGRGINKTPAGDQPFAWHGAPEHLMFAALAAAEVPQTLPAARLLQMVHGMFAYNSRDNGFLTDGTPESLDRLNRTVDAFEAELAAFLARAEDGCVHLLAQAERAELRASGVDVRDHPGKGA
ncbi:MAG: hypothetical protein EXR79_08490 [Myxococcales bacterium]|nr:hypothetical protein [Myxococcales bacterium]